MAHVVTFPNELKQEPFSFPEEFPIPPDATKLERTKLANGYLYIGFMSKMSTQDLHSFYLDKMEGTGLTSMPAYDSVGQEKMVLMFEGWPGRRRLFISVINEWFRSPKNFRSAMITLSPPSSK